MNVDADPEGMINGILPAEYAAMTQQQKEYYEGMYALTDLPPDLLIIINAYSASIRPVVRPKCDACVGCNVELRPNPSHRPGGHRYENARLLHDTRRTRHYMCFACHYSMHVAWAVPKISHCPKCRKIYLTNVFRR